MKKLGRAQIHSRSSIYPGGYFLIADSHPLPAPDYCKALIVAARVACVPMDVFYHRRPAPASLVRFAICKAPESIDAAAAAIRAHPVSLVAPHSEESGIKTPQQP